MSSDMEAAGPQLKAEIEEVLAVLRRVDETYFAATGRHLTSPPARSVLDMPARAFVSQARIYAAVADIIERWELPASTRTLGALLKTSLDAAEIARLLGLAGHLPADD